jgi:hypothetical protein
VAGGSAADLVIDCVVITVLLGGAPACQVRVALQLVAVPLLRYPAEVPGGGRARVNRGYHLLATF